MATVLGVEIAGELHDALEVTTSLTGSARSPRPSDSGFGANVVLAAGSGTRRESVQVSLVVAERESLRAPHRQPRIDAPR
jgi:hypothetical protein